MQNPTSHVLERILHIARTILANYLTVHSILSLLAVIIMKMTRCLMSFLALNSECMLTGKSWPENKNLELLFCILYGFPDQSTCFFFNLYFCHLLNKKYSLLYCIEWIKLEQKSRFDIYMYVYIWNINCLISRNDNE